MARSLKLLVCDRELRNQLKILNYSKIFFFFFFFVSLHRRGTVPVGIKHDINATMIGFSVVSPTVIAVHLNVIH